MFEEDYSEPPTSPYKQSEQERIALSRMGAELQRKKPPQTGDGTDATILSLVPISKDWSYRHEPETHAVVWRRSRFWVIARAAATAVEPKAREGGIRPNMCYAVEVYLYQTPTEAEGEGEGWSEFFTDYSRNPYRGYERPLDCDDVLASSGGVKVGVAPQSS